MMTTSLNESQIAEKLAALDGWTVSAEGKLHKDFQCKDFKDALGFIVRIGLAAESMDHHPEIHNVYNRIAIDLTTHDAGGLTEKDFELAGAIDGLA